MPSGTAGRCTGEVVAIRCAPALPELAITTEVMVATRCAPALPELAITTEVMVATRCAPALPELAIATGGSLDFSSFVYRGRTWPARPMIDEPEKRDSHRHGDRRGGATGWVVLLL